MKNYGDSFNVYPFIQKMVDGNVKVVLFLSDLIDRYRQAAANKTTFPGEWFPCSIKDLARQGSAGWSVREQTRMFFVLVSNKLVQTKTLGGERYVRIALKVRLNVNAILGKDISHGY